MATSHNRKTTERKKSFRRFIYEKALRKIRMLHQAPCASESTRILCAKRKIVRLRMIFHSAKNDFACCCKRFYAVYHLPHPYNEIERKKGSHPSYYLWFNPLRWTFFLTAFTCPSRTPKFQTYVLKRGIHLNRIKIKQPHSIEFGSFCL